MPHMNKNKSAINFLFEITTLKRLQRTGWQILGEGKESIAEHSYMVAMISYLLAQQTNADIQKTLVMALFHDTEEARTGDAYRLAKLYITIDKKQAQKDLLQNISHPEKIHRLLEEYEKRESLESKIVKDADNLSLCFELKPMVEKGNTQAKEWLDANVAALQLSESQELGKALLEVDSQSWWKKEREKLHSPSRKR